MSLTTIKGAVRGAKPERAAPGASASAEESSRPAALRAKQYWRSLDQLADTPEFREWLHREFKDNATEMLEGESRRNVLKIMAASFGLAGLAACRRPIDHILPFAKGAEDYIPGQQLFYSTVMPLNGDAAGLLVEAHDGRPTKIEGNPDHPVSLGAATALAQGALLNLYDPDRLQHVMANGQESNWQNFEQTVKALPLGDGSGLRFLSETVVSPTLAAQRAQALAKYPRAKWIEYESIARDNERAGAMLAFAVRQGQGDPGARFGFPGA